MILIAVLVALLTLLGSMIAWRLSYRYQCASIADIFWPLHHIVSMTTMLFVLPKSINEPELITIMLVLLWGFRLATHLSIRQAGAPEDARYRAIRSRIGADFGRKSLYLIFAPQALMAWFISLMLIPALTTAEWNAWAYSGLLLTGAGLIWEITADLQLSAFLKQRASPATTDSGVLDQGLWSFSRHPNYFGEWVFWLGHAITAIALDNHFLVVALLAMGLLTFCYYCDSPGSLGQNLRLSQIGPITQPINQKCQLSFRIQINFGRHWRATCKKVEKAKYQIGWWLLPCTLPLYGFARHCERPVSPGPELAFRRPHRRKRRWLP